MFTSSIQRVLIAIQEKPELLRRILPDMKKKLHTQGHQDSQGIGNQATDQEACFADILENNGFLLSDPKSPSTIDGLFYIYQLNGSQQAVDFQVFSLQNQSKSHFLNFDLKHTKGLTFYLNDGWFNENVIYIISWVSKKNPQTFIGLGQSIPTPDETEMFQTLCQIKRDLNEKYKGVDHFRSYVRFANQYKCSRFTLEFTQQSFQNVLSFIQPQQKRKRPIIKSFLPFPTSSNYDSDSKEQEEEHKEQVKESIYSSSSSSSSSLESDSKEST